MCLEVSYRNIRITERWKRNISVVCAWKYHTEILEYNTSISLPSLCNSNISVWYFQAHTTLLFLFHASLCNSNISVWYFQAELQRDAWKGNRSVVCAWKYHTEILELQRDGREIEVLYVLGRHLSVILIFLYDTTKHIHHFYLSSTHLSVILIFLYDTSRHIQHF
jgi:hypothetical protein